MWHINNIQATNFMSFESIAYTFEQKCYVVRADNKDNEGQQSNGGGKTSFVDIIAVALLGYSLTGRNVKDCVRWDSEDSSFTVQCELINKSHNLKCSIVRKIYSNTKGQELTLLVNDKVPKTLPTKKGVENAVDVKAGNKYILESILDITEQDLLSYFLISKSHYQPFLAIGTDAKLDVISRFSKSEVVDKVIGTLQLDLDTLDDSIQEYERMIANCNGYIEALSDSLNNSAMAEKFEADKQRDIISLSTTIQRTEQQLLDNEEQINTQNQLRDQLQITQLDPQDKIDLNTRLKGLTDEEFVKLRDKINEELQQIKNYLSGLITCPKCTHKFHLSVETNWSEDDLLQREIIIGELDQEIALVKKYRQEIQEDIDLIEQVERENKTIQNEFEIIGRRIASIERAQLELMKQLDEAQVKLDTVQSRTFVDQQTDISQQIQGKQEEQQVLEQQLQECLVEKDLFKQWITNFEDFKFFLGNKPIEMICTLVNNYLSLNGSDLNLFIEGFKKLRSGELRQALQPVIYRNWNNPQTFHQFSEGEKVRLNLAVDLSFQQLINQSSKFGGLDLYCSDEIINPLDSIGVANAANAFNQLGKTIILVTHSGADLVYENTILIQKQNGKSTI